MAAAAPGQLDRLAARRENLADDARPVSQQACLSQAAPARDRIEHPAEQVRQATQAAAAAHRLAAYGELAVRLVAHPARSVGHRVHSSPNRERAGNLLLALAFPRIISSRRSRAILLKLSRMRACDQRSERTR
jgi:hypothetical protein